MIAAIDQIAFFIGDSTLDEFLADEKTKSAVLFQLIVIGEAAGRLPADVRQRFPEVNWGPVIAFRNRVVHGYFSLDWSIVWQAATDNIVRLRPIVVRIVDSDLSD